LIKNNIEIVLPRKVFKVAYFLAKNCNRCVTRHALIKNCWETGVIVTDRTIDVHICKIKNALNDRKIIKTVKCRGYMWVEKWFYGSLSY
jgi:two-component system alkaline phosphatase synthesis response regulator PhoP